MLFSVVIIKLLPDPWKKILNKLSIRSPRNCRSTESHTQVINKHNNIPCHMVAVYTRSKSFSRSWKAISQRLLHFHRWYMFVKSLQTEDNVTRIETHFRANGIATDKVAAIHGWQSEIPHEIKQKNKVWNNWDICLRYAQHPISQVNGWPKK